MKIAVRDIKDNPFRDMERNPINEAKVAVLVGSIKETSFWDNIVVRPLNGEKYELAYGHHRLRALKKSHIDEINIPVRKLDDAIMLKMMANENMEEWGATPAVMAETIRAIVQAYAEDRIELPKPDEKTSKNQIRYAPDFTVESGDARARGHAHPYTAESIAEFLGGGEGWHVGRIKSLLDWLILEKSKVVKPAMMRGLTISGVQALVRTAKRFKENPDIAKAVTREIAEELQSGTLIATHDTRRKEEVDDRASIIAAKHGHRESTDKKKPKELPDQDRATMRLADEMERFTPSMLTRCRQLAEVVKFIGAKPRAALAKAIRKHIAIWEKLADELEG